MSDPVIRVEGLGKRYKVGERERYLALRDILARALAAPFRRREGAASKGRDWLWALRDISFGVKQGKWSA